MTIFLCWQKNWAQRGSLTHPILSALWQDRYQGVPASESVGFWSATHLVELHSCVCLSVFSITRNLKHTRVLLGASTAASYLHRPLCSAAALGSGQGGPVRLCRVVIAPLDTERVVVTSGLPRWLSSEESAYSAGATGDTRSVPGGEDPLEEGEAPTPVLSPGECPGQRSLAGCPPWGHKEPVRTEAAERDACSPSPQRPYFAVSCLFRGFFFSPNKLLESKSKLSSMQSRLSGSLSTSPPSPTSLPPQGVLC